MRSIVTLTMNPALDVATATQTITPSIKLRCEAPRYDPGGGGINVARAVHRLGGEALAVFPAGGASGQMIQALLAEEHVPQIGVPVTAVTRQSLAVSERDSGRQYRFVLPGPPLAVADCERVLAALAAHAEGAAFVVASGSLPPGVPADFYARVARLAQSCDARFALDASGAALSEARGPIYLIKASRRELEQLHGAAVESENAQEEAAMAVIAQRRCEVLVVSLGAEGALLASADGVRRFAAPGVPAVSSIGAGDAMLAAILLALVRGWTLVEAVRFGVAAGTASLLQPGTELCRRDDVERLYRELAPL
ncbi:MAG: 1-phosphofructokinase family hexose kinase [Thiohalocapsa sp.]